MENGKFWQQMRPFNRRMVQNYFHGIGPKKLLLLLTTIGRKTGKPRITPLQYESVDSVIFIASARGPKADWFQNLITDGNVRVQIGKREFNAWARPILEAEKIADFLELRLLRHPIMMRLIMCLFEGLPWRFNRRDLVKFAEKKAVAIIVGKRDFENGQAGFEEEIQAFI